MKVLPVKFIKIYRVIRSYIYKTLHKHNVDTNVIDLLSIRRNNRQCGKHEKAPDAWTYTDEAQAKNRVAILSKISVEDYITKDEIIESMGFTNDDGKTVNIIGDFSHFHVDLE